MFLNNLFLHSGTFSLPYDDNHSLESEQNSVSATDEAVSLRDVNRVLAYSKAYKSCNVCQCRNKMNWLFFLLVDLV